MQPQQNFGSPGTGEQSCTQCGAPMPREMRFCRSCGHRLGEGPAEYTETVRFPGATSANRGGQTTPFYPTFNAPMATVSPGRRRSRLGWKGTTWLWIALVIIFGMGGLMSLARKNRISIPRPPVISSSRSWVGVDNFVHAADGVTFRNTDIPGGPADKAGLVGGDIITSFDGVKISQSNEIMDVLVKTPVGKQVEVIYLRDGIIRTTQLITISRDEYNRLQSEYDRRPEGKGMFGFQSNRMTRVISPETKTFGVRIDYVEPNGPADLFGIKEGDVITDFDKVPIRTPEEFLARVKRALPRSIVEVKLLRNGQPMTIPVTMGKS